MDRLASDGLPTVTASIKRLKDDITFEKQYTDLIDYDLVSSSDESYSKITSILESNKYVDSPEFRALGCFIGKKEK